MEAMTTIVLDYKTDQESALILSDYVRQYCSCLHVMYNYIKDNNLSTNYQNHTTAGSHVLEKLKSLNNVDLIKNHYYLVQCAISNACDMIKSEDELRKADKKKLEMYRNDLRFLEAELKKPTCKNERRCRKKAKSIRKKIDSLEGKRYVAVFGGRKNFTDRCKGLITRDQFLDNKQSLLYSKGSKEHFNRLFEFVDDTTILFKPTRDVHIKLHIQPNKHTREISSLIVAQKNKELPCTFKIGKDKLYISYNPSKLNERKYCKRAFVKDRVMSIDLNPNYIGWCITDWRGEGSFRIVKSGVFSIKDINDEHFNLKGKHIPSGDPRRVHISNKRKHEVFEISKSLVNMARHYMCETFSVESLSIDSDDKNRGTRYNSLCNNLWCMERLVSNLRKRCATFRVEFMEIMPNYSSFVGNFLFRSLNLPDMVLAAFEITRRTYQYKYNNTLQKEERKKNILLPDQDAFIGFLSESLEEFGLGDTYQGLRQTYESFKKARTMYRLSLDGFRLEFRRFHTFRSKVKRHQFEETVTHYNNT